MGVHSVVVTPLPEHATQPPLLPATRPFAAAHAEALKSVETFRLGAVLVHRRAVVSRGHNRNINSCGLSSIHAEMDAVWKARPVHGRGPTHLVVVRVLRDGITTACSKPCPACASALARAGVSKVIYTTGDASVPLATMKLTCT